MSYDAIVIGLGAMGSAATYQLVSRRDRSRLRPSARRTSSARTGLTRIHHLAYFEHPDYVPMLKAAWELWPRIEAEAGNEQLIKVTGGLYVGRRGSAVLDGSLKSAETHGHSSRCSTPTKHGDVSRHSISTRHGRAPRNH